MVCDTCVLGELENCKPATSSKMHSCKKSFLLIFFDVIGLEPPPPPPLPLPFLREPPLSVYPLFLKQIKNVTPLFLTAIQIGACKLYKGVTFCTIQVIIITLYTFRLNSIFTAETFFSQMLPLMFFIFDVQEE